MGPRWRKVFRDLSSHWFRTMLVVLSIAIGIFAVGVVLGGREILLREFDKDFAASVPANVTYRTADFGDDVVSRAADEPGVSAAQGRRVVDRRFTRSGDDADRTLTLEAVKDFRDIRVEKVESLSGTWPPARGEVVLEASAKMVADYAIGETLEVEGSDGSPVELEIVGFAHDINAMPAHLVGNETGYVSFDTMAELGETREYNQLLLAFTGKDLTWAEASRRATSIREQLFGADNIPVFNTRVPEPGSHFIGDIFSALSLLLLSLGVLALGLSGFLVINTVSAVMASQVKQVGIMKAIGGRAVQLEQLYAVAVASYGVLAVAVGLPGTAAGTRWFTDFAGDMLNFRISDYSPPPWVIGIEIAVGLLVPLLAAASPVRKGVRMSVVRALNGEGMTGTRFGNRLTDRVLGMIRGLPRPVALSLRNTFRRKGRLALTLSTLTLASAVVMAIFSVQSSMDRTISDLESWWRYNVQVAFAAPQDPATVVAEVEDVPGVVAAEAWAGYPATFVRKDGTENEAFNIVGLTPGTDFVKPNLLEGRWLKPGDTDAIVINTDAQNEESSLQVGREVRIDVRGKEATWHIVGLVKGQLGGASIYCDEGRLDSVVGTSAATYLVVKGTGSSTGKEDELLDAVETRLTDAGYQVRDAQTRSGLGNHVADLLGILVAFLFVLAALLAIVGMIGLTGTMTMNVLESTREIGVMRATGAQHKSIYQIYMSEGMTVGALAWALGAVIGYPISLGLVRGLEQAMGIPLSYAFSWAGVGAWLVLMLVIAALASIAPAFRASQVSVRDAIAYE